MKKRPTNKERVDKILAEKKAKGNEAGTAEFFRQIDNILKGK